MKIGIVTIYKCYNYGSFYQAYGLQKYLQDLGHEVKFLPIDSLYNKKYRIRKQFNKDISGDLFSLKLLHGYLHDWKLYNIADKNEDDFDLIIIGSDEIWNINNRTFVPAPEYYGLNMTCSNIISYASCIGRSTVGDFDKYKDFIRGIRGLHSVSARDDATEHFLRNLMPETQIQRVLDPSFLINWKSLEKPCSRKNFILVYTYDGSWGFPEEYIAKTRRFADQMKLPLVSVGFKNDWCDESIACSPREFLGYLHNASYVVTDTFHGTVMSIQFQKQFVCMGAGKSKVESILRELNLQDRLFDADRQIMDYFSNAIDYSTVKQCIDEKCEVSKCYLQSKLNNDCNSW